MVTIHYILIVIYDTENSSFWSSYQIIGLSNYHITKLLENDILGVQ